MLKDKGSHSIELRTTPTQSYQSFMLNLLSSKSKLDPNINYDYNSII